jgi:hypothetical protein
MDSESCIKCGSEPIEIGDLCYTCEIVGAMDIIEEIGEYLSAYEDVS